MADLGTATAFDGDPPFATESQVEAALANGLLFATFYLPSATGTAAYEEIVRIDRSDQIKSEVEGEGEIESKSGLKPHEGCRCENEPFFERGALRPDMNMQSPATSKRQEPAA